MAIPSALDRGGPNGGASLREEAARVRTQRTRTGALPRVRTGRRQAGLPPGGAGGSAQSSARRAGRQRRALVANAGGVDDGTCGGGGNGVDGGLFGSRGDAAAVRFYFLWRRRIGAAKPTATFRSCPFCGSKRRSRPSSTLVVLKVGTEIRFGRCASSFSSIHHHQFRYSNLSPLPPRASIAIFIVSVPSPPRRRMGPKHSPAPPDAQFNFFIQPHARKSAQQ